MGVAEKRDRYKEEIVRNILSLRCISTSQLLDAAVIVGSLFVFETQIKPTLALTLFTD